MSPASILETDGDGARLAGFETAMMCFVGNRIRTIAKEAYFDDKVTGPYDEFWHCYGGFFYNIWLAANWGVY